MAANLKPAEKLLMVSSCSWGLPTINWWFEVPQGKISYIIEVKDGQWIEKGNIDMGGGRSFPFMEMVLEKE